MKMPSSPLPADWFANPQNFGELGEEYSSFQDSRLVVLPVPYDATVEYKGGTRFGPQAILSASRYLELYDLELDAEPSRVGIHTLPEVLPCAEGPVQMVERVHHIYRHLLDQHKTVAMLGGEHSLTIGAVQAYREQYTDLSVLQLDAHADLREEHQGTRYTHATVMRRLWEQCPVVSVGIRSLSLEEKHFQEEHRLPVFFYHGPASFDQGLMEGVLAALSSTVYVTVDMDVFDPSFMAAVGTPEPGGMLWHEVVALLAAVAGRKRIVGIDVMELCPSEGPSSCAFIAAKLAYKLMGYAMLSQGYLDGGGTHQGT